MIHDLMIHDDLDLMIHDHDDDVSIHDDDDVSMKFLIWGRLEFFLFVILISIQSIM